MFDRKAIDVLMSAFSNQRSLAASSQPQPLARTTTMDSTISAVSTVPSSPGGAEKDPNKIRPIPTPKAAMLADLGGEPALSQLTTLRMDGCGLRGAVLEALGELILPFSNLLYAQAQAEAYNFPQLKAFAARRSRTSRSVGTRLARSAASRSRS